MLNMASDAPPTGGVPEMEKEIVPFPTAKLPGGNVAVKDGIVDEVMV
jgi:hypothetical protein